MITRCYSAAAAVGMVTVLHQTVFSGFPFARKKPPVLFTSHMVEHNVSPSTLCIWR